MADRAVLVVGAGPAGLAGAAQLQRLGVPAVVLERADHVAASWRNRYDRLRLNTCRWTSKLPDSRYPRGAGLFPTRDQMVAYLEHYADSNQLDIRPGVRVESIDREDGGWSVRTTDGTHLADHVIVATGHQHTPQIPPWPGRDEYQGRLLHAADYRNPDDFQGLDVLVVGPGSSGMEIAHDLGEGGAGRVWLALRTQPNMILRQSGGLPGDVPARAALRLPPRVADRITFAVRRLSIGDLSSWGLTPPEEGIFSRMHRDAKVPAIIDKEVIDAIKSGRLEIVGAVASLDPTGVLLADGTRVEPGAIIAATGYGSGLEPLVGHLGVLDERGYPLIQGGPAAAPGLRFIGYWPVPGQIGEMGREARRAAKEIKRELDAAKPPARASVS